MFIALDDPSQRQQARVLQFIIAGIIAILFIANLFVLLGRSQMPTFIYHIVLITNLGAAALMLIPWFLLRYGYYQTAVLVLIGQIFLGIGSYLFIEGISQSYFLLLFAIPITLSGLLLGRYALWSTILFSIVLLSAAALTITPPVRPYNPYNILISFTLLIVLQGLLLDRLVAGLWRALADALQQGKILAEREQEKQKLLAAAEQHIRERERIEAVLHQTQKLESLGVMASGIAHDFNNLLSAMLGQATVAKLKLPTESPAIKHIDRAIAAAEQAANLTRQLLIYSGRGQVEQELTNLNQIVTDNVHLLDVAIPESIEIKYSLMPHLPLIMADHGQMQQVIMNLVLNGAQAIGDKAGYVKLSTQIYEVTAEDEPITWQYGGNVPEPGPYVMLQVQDNGEGMSPETLSRVFEPFFTTKQTGHGLGLASVLGIVRTHHGGIQVESTPGKGTCFRLFFPATTEKHKHSDIQTPVPPSIHPLTASGLILIIDDDAAVIATLSDILSVAGFSLLTATDGLAGLQIYETHQSTIALVILDISMPGVDGIETLHRLQELNPDIPVIISSGLNRTGKLLPLTLDPTISYLHKPYTAEKVLAEVTRRLNELALP